MAIQGVSQFTPQRIVQVDNSKKPNPWASVAPSLVSNIIMGLVQNKLQQSTNKEQLTNEMQAKGYTWDEAGQRWIPPALNTQDIGNTGAVLAQQGDWRQVIQNPEVAAALEDRLAANKQSRAYNYDVGLSGVQSRNRRAELADQLQLQNTYGRDIAGYESNLKKDEMKTKAALDYQAFQQELADRSKATIQPLEADGKPTGKALITSGFGTSIIDTHDPNWVDENGNPKTGSVNIGGRDYGYVMTNKGQAQIVGEGGIAGRGMLTKSQAMEQLRKTLLMTDIDENEKTKVMSDLVGRMSKNQDPMQALDEVLQKSSLLSPPAENWKGKSLKDIEEAYKSGVLKTREDLIRATTEAGIK